MDLKSQILKDIEKDIRAAYSKDGLLEGYLYRSIFYSTGQELVKTVMKEQIRKMSRSDCPIGYSSINTDNLANNFDELILIYFGLLDNLMAREAVMQEFFNNIVQKTRN